jgi:hypothetical protein
MRVAALLATTLLASAATWTDPPGDASGAPDVTAVQVARAAGALEFTVRTASADAWPDAVAFIPLDTKAGGDEHGFDFELTLHSEHDLATMERWTGTAWEPTDEQPSFALQGATLTMGIPLTAVGGPASVRFAVQTRSFAGGDDAGPWTYSTRAVSFAPERPVHGRAFSATGASSCTAKLAGKKLRGACRWTIPVSARGKQLMVVADAKTYRFRVR